MPDTPRPSLDWSNWKKGKVFSLRLQNISAITERTERLCASTDVRPVVGDVMTKHRSRLEQGQTPHTCTLGVLLQNGEYKQTKADMSLLITVALRQTSTFDGDALINSPVMSSKTARQSAIVVCIPLTHSWLCDWKGSEHGRCEPQCHRVLSYTSLCIQRLHSQKITLWEPFSKVCGFRFSRRCRVKERLNCNKPFARCENSLHKKQGLRTRNPNTNTEGLVY